MRLELKLAQWCEGELSLEQLHSALDSGIRSLCLHREGFQRTLSALTEAEVLHTWPWRQACLEGLEEMEERLFQLEDLAREGRRSDFISVADSVSRLRLELDKSFSDFTHQALLFRGPSEIPNLNLLLSLQEEYDSAPTESVRSRFESAVAGEIALAEGTVIALELKSGASPAWPALKQAFTHHLQWLKALQQELVQANSDVFELTQQLTTTYLDINSLLPVVCAEIQESGRTEFPQLNTVLNLLREVAAGRQGVKPLLQVMDDFEDSLEQLGVGIGEAPAGTVPEREIELLAEALSLFMDALESVHAFDDTRDVKCLHAAEHKLVEFATVLQYFFHSSEALETDEEQDLLVTAQLEPVYRAVDDILQARIGVADYQAALNRFQTYLLGQARKPALEKFLGEIEIISTGLRELKLFSEHGNEARLKEGVRIINGGVTLLQQSLAVK